MRFHFFNSAVIANSKLDFYANSSLIHDISIAEQIEQLARTGKICARWRALSTIALASLFNNNNLPIYIARIYMC